MAAERSAAARKGKIRWSKFVELCFFMYIRNTNTTLTHSLLYDIFPDFTPAKGSEDFGEQVLTKAVKAGRRTYFFDVRATRGGDYFLTITESRKNESRRDVRLRQAQDFPL